MAKAVTLKLVVIDPNDVFDDLQSGVEKVLMTGADLIIVDKNIDEFEFDFDDDAPYNYAWCSYEDAVSALYEQVKEQEHE